LLHNSVITSDQWVGTVWPVDRWCRYQPVASSSKQSTHFRVRGWGTV